MLALDIDFDEDKTLPMLDLDENTATVVGNNMHSLTLCSDWKNENLASTVCKDCAAKMEDFIQKPYSFYFKTSEKKYVYWPER
jgi:hypothetical protein